MLNSLALSIIKILNFLSIVDTSLDSFSWEKKLQITTVTSSKIKLFIKFNKTKLLVKIYLS
jgi:hypothetical protein